MKPSKLSYVKVWKLAFFYFVIAASGLLSLSGCESKQKPSFIIVALDRLSFNSLSCVDEKATLNSGFDILCKEAIRFTHAYTTSVQPAAALASLLTGSYPYSHGLHRSSGRLLPNQSLISEAADQQGYRTAFLSSSPGIMKKTGLAKGFDIFDDLTFLDRKNYLTTFKRQSEMFFNWIRDGKHPSFTVIYNSELESLSDAEADTTTFEKLDETLAGFFAELKVKNLWESSYVIVVGLQGVSDYSRPDESLMSNLHSENTNISMFVKPPRQQGDDGVNWKIDTVVTIADLGLSLFKTLSPDFQKSIDEHFPQIDFSNLWKTKSNVNRIAPNERKIIVESTNPWSDSIETRYALLQGNLIYIEKQSDELFNSLNDGLETIDISSSATSAQNDFKNECRRLLSAIREKTNQGPWLQYKTEFDEWIESNRKYWSNPNSRTEILDIELARFRQSHIKQPLTALMIQNLLNNNKLEILKQLDVKLDYLKVQSEKDAYFEEARRQSMNLALENLWGLWGKNKSWIQSNTIKEYQ